MARCTHQNVAPLAYDPRDGICLDCGDDTRTFQTRTKSGKFGKVINVSACVLDYEYEIWRENVERDSQ